MIVLMGLLMVSAAVSVFYGVAAGLRLVDEDRPAVHAAVAVLVLAVVPAQVCRLAGNMPLAVLLTALAAAGFFAVARRSLMDRPRSFVWEAPHPAAMLCAVAATACVQWATVERNFYDEEQHFGIALVMAHGIVPPEHPLFPGEAMRYHYAVDGLYAEFISVVGLEVDDAIDIVTLGSWLLLLFLATACGRALGGRAGASFGLVLIPLASGILVRSGNNMTSVLPIPIPPSWLAPPSSPPTIENFFQHPQGLAMPLALGLLLFASAETTHAPRRRAAVTSVLLGLLSLVNAAYFSVLLVALVALWLVRTMQQRSAGAMVDGAFLLGAGLLAVLLGGFFRAGGSAFFQLGRQFFLDPGLLGLLGHHLFAFGLPLLAIPLTALRLRATEGAPAANTLRWCLAVAGAVGFLIPNLVGYERSWDVVKFYAIGAFFGAALLTDLLAATWERRPSFLPRTAILLGATLSIAGSCKWLISESILKNANEELFPWEHVVLVPWAEEVGRKLAPFVHPRSRVLTSQAALAQSTGILTPGLPWQLNPGLMSDRARAEEMTRHAQAALQSMESEHLAALDVDFVVLFPEDVANLSEAGRAALLDSGRFTELFTVALDGSEIQVFRVAH
jgi:hypothetical protein